MGVLEVRVSVLEAGPNVLEAGQGVLEAGPGVLKAGLSVLEARLGVVGRPEYDQNIEACYGTSILSMESGQLRQSSASGHQHRKAASAGVASSELSPGIAADIKSGLQLLA